jgi:serine/threonine-protein kinase
MIIEDPILDVKRAKVLDFGIAKLQMETEPLTRQGAMLGTPAYMAIEQFRDSAAVNGKADVFALGCITYELLTGKLPHKGQTAMELAASRVLDAVPPLGQLAPSVPEPVAKLVMAMLEKEAPSRPTMLQVLTDLRQSLGMPAPRQSGVHAVTTPAVEPTRILL